MTTPAPEQPRLEVDAYEKRWIQVSIVLLIVFGAIITFTSFAYGIQVPVPEQRVDPNTVAEEGPFAEPGLRELAPGKYEAYILAQIWFFTPNEIRVPVGSSVTFYLTSTDVQHGVILEDTNINVMILPGQVSRLTAHFDEPGEFNFYCHEYCGVGHQAMFGRVIVEAGP